MERLECWPNVERDQQGRVVGFSGLTLRPTAHSLRVGDRQLYAWCAWDTLFLPALLDETAGDPCSGRTTDADEAVRPAGALSRSAPPARR